MKGSELRLIEYMEGSKKRFIIPVYQRNYDWKIENCKQLYDDLIQVIKNNSKTHFFGSIVSVYEPSGRNTEFLIIDGQQRLTTMSLLFLALYNLLEEKIIISEDESLKDQIYEDFLVDKYQPQEKRMKLKPIKNDQKAFSKLFNSKDDYIKDSNLREIIYVFLTIFLYLPKCPQSLILSALRAFCFCGKPRISRSIFLYFPCQSWLKSW